MLYAVLMDPTADRRAIPVYLLFTWSASSLFYFLIIRSAGTRAADGAYTSGLMWCPAIGALLACKYLGRPIASLGWKWGRTRYQVISYLIPLGYSAVTYSVAWLTGIAALNPIQTAEAFTRFFGLGQLSRPAGVGFIFLDVATIGVIQNCATTLGEEIGWRGFALPRMQARYGPLWGTLQLGIAWGFWHALFFLTPDHGGGPGTSFITLLISFFLFLLMVIGLAIIFTWVFNHTHGSLFIASLLHSSIDTPQLVWIPLFPGLTETRLDLALLIGLGLPALLIVILTRCRLGYQPGGDMAKEIAGRLELN